MRWWPAAVLFAVFTWGAWGQQSGDDTVIDSILAQKSITLGNAAWLVGRAAGTFDDSITPDQAASRAVAQGWVGKAQKSDDPLDLQDFGFLLVKAFQVPGGLLYGWFPGPRYALRELVFRKVIPSTLAPDDSVSGEEAMRYLQATQDWKDGTL